MGREAACFQNYRTEPEQEDHGEVVEDVCAAVAHRDGAPVGEDEESLYDPMVHALSAHVDDAAPRTTMLACRVPHRRSRWRAEDAPPDPEAVDVAVDDVKGECGRHARHQDPRPEP